jgi:flavin-dependent dehydrogenase
LLQIPDEVIEHKVVEIGLNSQNNENYKILPESVVFIVNRRVFADWQLHRLDGTSVEVRMNTKVTSIKEKNVLFNGNEEIEFDYLVGGEEPNSMDL